MGVDERDHLAGEVGARGGQLAAGAQSPAPAAAAGAAETVAALSSATSMGIVRRANRGARTGAARDRIGASWYHVPSTAR